MASLATDFSSNKEKDHESGLPSYGEGSVRDPSIHVASAYIKPGERVENVSRGLKSRHMSMIAIGGVLGSGLFIGTGGALATGGPVGILLGYGIMGLVVYTTMIAGGEMAALYPISGGFVMMSSRFLDPAMGFALGWNYWYEMIVSIPAEISAGYIVIEFWNVGGFRVEYWILIYIVFLALVNFSPIRVYGEVEFWFAIIKVLTIIGLIVACLVIDLGGVAGQDRIGFRYWSNPGPFPQLNGIPGSLGRFLSFWTVFLQAAFVSQIWTGQTKTYLLCWTKSGLSFSQSFLGTEVVILVAAEAQNPRVTIPRATKAVFYRILVFYLGGVFVIGWCVPFNDPKLVSDTGNANSSPFVIAIENAGIKTLPAIVNACITMATFSAGNSYVYAGSRSLYGLALDKQAPRIFLKTWNRTPIFAVLGTLIFGLLGFMTVSGSASEAFDWFVSLSSITGVLCWMCILASYLRFRAACFKQGVDRSKFPYQAPLQPYLSWFGLLFLGLVVIFNGFQVFLTGGWSVSDFVSAYASVPIFLVFYLFWKFYKKTRFVRLDEMDLSGRQEYEAGEQEEEQEEETRHLKGNRGIIKRIIHVIPTTLGFRDNI